MQNDVSFITYDGGLGRALEGQDHYSGFVFNAPSIATTFYTVYSLNEAEVAGIDASTYPNFHYHVEQYFVQQPKGVLFVSIGGDPLADAVKALQSYADGSIRQMAVLDSEPFATSTVSALQAAAANLQDEHMGLSILYAADFTSFTLNSLPTLATSSCNYVSVVVGADVSFRSALGAALGVTSLAKVSENIGDLKQFNVAKGTEFDTLGFSTFEVYKGVTSAQLNALNDKGYVFLCKYTGFAGSYFRDSKTATSPTSDFVFIENNRAIEKARRAIRVALLPELKGRLKTKNGKLFQETISTFELLVQNQLDAMVDANELSEYKVVINPAQNVNTTSRLEIQVGLTPLGIAREIVVGIGFQL